MTIAWIIVAVVVAGIAFLLIPKFFSPSFVMSGCATNAVDAARKKFQVDLDWSEESIQRLEEVAALQHAAHAQGKLSGYDLSRYSDTWGGYLGEVFRKHHGGAWVRGTNGPYKGLMVLETGSKQICPSAKVHKRLVNGDEDNLAVYYQFLVRSTKDSGG